MMVDIKDDHDIDFEQCTSRDRSGLLLKKPSVSFVDRVVTCLVRLISGPLILVLGLHASLAAASCQNPVYPKCPSDSEDVNSLYVRPWHLLIDTVVVDPVPGQSSDWVYHWCLKADPPVDTDDDEFDVDWRDTPIDWNTRTECHGYAGVRFPFSSPPTKLIPTKIYIGTGRTIIRPNVQKPQNIESAAISGDEHQYGMTIAAVLPVKKGASAFGKIEIVIRSAFRRSEEDPGLVNYSFEYTNQIEEEMSFASFMFDPDSTSHVDALKGVFTPTNESQHIEFSSR